MIHTTTHTAQFQTKGVIIPLPLLFIRPEPCLLLMWWTIPVVILLQTHVHVELTWKHRAGNITACNRADKFVFNWWDIERILKWKKTAKWWFKPQKRIFQQDNNSQPTSCLLKEYFLIEGPSQSPDPNPTHHPRDTMEKITSAGRSSGVAEMKALLTGTLGKTLQVL